MIQTGMYNKFILLLGVRSKPVPRHSGWEAGGKRCAGFAQFWEAVGSKTSHIAIDNQWKHPKLRSNKKLRSLGSSRGKKRHVHSAISFSVTVIFAGIISNTTHDRHSSYCTCYQYRSFGVAGIVGTQHAAGIQKGVCGIGNSGCAYRLCDGAQRQKAIVLSGKRGTPDTIEQGAHG